MACEVFAWLESSGNSAATSTITMTELLVHPYRARNEGLVNEYYGLLTQLPNLEWIAPDLATADAAARIRAFYGLRTPDALQVATAIACGASALLTNDSDIARIPEIEIAVLERLR
jgi:predicted nucleic acid-binding protein